MVDGTDTESSGWRRLRAAVRLTLLTSLVLLLVVPSVLLGDAAWAGATVLQSVEQLPRRAEPGPALVFQAIRCPDWADVPGNFTPDVPVDDTEGRYRGWGPLDPAVVEAVELNRVTGDCVYLDGVRFRVSAAAWGVELLEESPATTSGAEPTEPADAGSRGLGPQQALSTDAAPDSVADTDGAPDSAADTDGGNDDDDDADADTHADLGIDQVPVSPATGPAPNSEPDPTTSTVAGVTGSDGDGRLVAPTAELSEAQQAALLNGSGLWVAASGFEDSFANLRCHADRYNADNLEVIRAGEADTSMVCVLYVVQAGTRSPAAAPPAVGPPSLPTLDPRGPVTIMVPSGPGSGAALPAATDPGAAIDQPEPEHGDGSAPVEVPAGSIGGGLDISTAPAAAMAPGQRALQEGLADLDSRPIDHGRWLERDLPLSAPQAIVGTAEATATPAPPVLLGPRLAGSRTTSLVGVETLAPLRAPVTQNLTAALAAGLSALFLTGLGITIKVAGRPF